MGIAIGQISQAGIASAVAPAFPSRASNEGPAPSLGVSAGDEEENAALLGRERPEPPRVGFGDGTTSLPGEAVRTLRGGLRSAERLVPDVEESREELRARLSEQREQRARELEERRRRRFEAVRRIPEPTTQARNYLNSLNRTAAASQARLEGEEPAPEESPARIQVNQETFELRRTADRPALNMLV